jgi:hypothetical protein
VFLTSRPSAVACNIVTQNQGRACSLNIYRVRAIVTQT